MRHACCSSFCPLNCLQGNDTANDLGKLDRSHRRNRSRRRRFFSAAEFSHFQLGTCRAAIGLLNQLTEVTGKSLLDAVQALGLTKYSEEDARPCPVNGLCFSLLYQFRCASLANVFGSEDVNAMLNQLADFIGLYFEAKDVPCQVGLSMSLGAHQRRHAALVEPLCAAFVCFVLLACLLGLGLAWFCFASLRLALLCLLPSLLACLLCHCPHALLESCNVG